MDLVCLRATILLSNDARRRLHEQVSLKTLLTCRFDYKMTYHYDALVQTTFTCPWGMLNTFLDPPPPKSKVLFKEVLIK